MFQLKFIENYYPPLISLPRSADGRENAYPNSAKRDSGPEKVPVEDDFSVRLDNEIQPLELTIGHLSERSYIQLIPDCGHKEEEHVSRKKEAALRELRLPGLRPYCMIYPLPVA